jgi:CRP-like cAMP-binding protein
VIPANRLLATLPEEQRHRLLTDSSIVFLERWAIVYEVGHEIVWTYFPISGLVSLMSTTRDGQTLELASVGNDGMFAIETVLQASSARCHVVAQLRTEALRIRAVHLLQEMERDILLRRTLLQYACRLLEQTSQTAVCHRFHTVAQRLARWLLIARDRLGSDVIHLSEERVGHLLGSPRTAVTTANVMLQDYGAIRQRHGRTFIIDVARLRKAACECYETGVSCHGRE